MSRDPIVVGTDGSATAMRAVDKAGELAQALDAPVHVVCAPGAIAAGDWPPRITGQQIVAEATEQLKGRGVTVQTHLPGGEAALELAAVADAQGAQMLVMGNKGMTGIRRFLGSLPNSVSHNARCDVLIVATQAPSPDLAGGTIVVGTDGSSGSGRAVKEAIRLSKALGGELHVVTTSTPPESALAAAAAEAADQGVSAITHGLGGNPADAVLDVAQDQDAVMVVVGNRGMQAGDRDWFGNVPDKISHSGTSTVLIVFTGEGAARDGGAMSSVATGEDANT
jgi:nucleotide-binding universal stress UspA family protein